MAIKTNNNEITEEQKETFLESIEWLFWDKKDTVALCNRLLNLIASTELDLDKKDKEAISIIIELQRAILEIA